MMRVIFLDLDGVVNNIPHRNRVREEDGGFIVDGKSYDWSRLLDPVNVARLERLVAASGAVLVVASDWRHHHHVLAIERMLRLRGAPNACVIDRCPNGDRGPSILDWLAAGHGDVVEAWIALDDCKEMGDAEHRTVRTDPQVGLTDADVDRAIRMLTEAT